MDVRQVGIHQQRVRHGGLAEGSPYLDEGAAQFASRVAFSLGSSRPLSGWGFSFPPPYQ
jgi:hypothetical protein